MYCPYCGKELLDSDKFCAHCGKRVGRILKHENIDYSYGKQAGSYLNKTSDNQAASAPETEHFNNQTANQSDHSKAGIGGWLLVYIIWLCVSLLWGVLVNISDALFLKDLGLSSLYFTSVLSFANLALGIILLGLLLCKKPSAIPVAIFFIVLQPLLSIFIIFANYNILENDYGHKIARNFLANYNWMQFSFNIIMTVIWFAYFRVSKRVKNTYPRIADPEPVDLEKYR